MYGSGPDGEEGFEGEEGSLMILYSFLLLPPKEKNQKKSHHLMKFAKNLRHQPKIQKLDPGKPGSQTA